MQELLLQVLIILEFHRNHMNSIKFDLKRFKYFFLCLS